MHPLEKNKHTGLSKFIPNLRKKKSLLMSSYQMLNNKAASDLLLYWCLGIDHF